MSELETSKNGNGKQLLLWGYAGILFLCAFIRIFDNAFWGDEAFTLRLAKYSLHDMLYATSVDVHPPLYYIFVQLAYRLLGNHGYVYHLVSVVAVLITLLTSITWIAKRYGDTVAVIFMTASVWFPAAFNYNLEVRMYSWSALLVLLGFLSMDCILKCDLWRDYVLFAVWTICAAYCHYYALVAVAFFYAFLAIRALTLRGANQTIWKSLLVCIMAVVSYIPWLLKFLLSFQRTATSWWLDSIPRVWDCALFLFGNAVWVLLFGLAVVLIWILDKEGRTWLLSGLFAIGGLIAVGLVSSHVIRPLFITRYTYVVASVAWLLMALGLGKGIDFLAGKVTNRAKVVQRVLMLSVVLLCVGCFGKNDWNEYKEEQRLDQVTKEFTEHVQIEEGTLIFTDSGPHAWTIIEYYYPNTRIGETYDLLGSLVENKEDCVALLSAELDDTALIEMKNYGFEAQEEYVGELGIQSELHVYRIICEEVY